VQATADGHPRAVAYVSRMSVTFLDKLKTIPFYDYLFKLQYSYTRSFTNRLYGRHGQGSPELTAARDSAYKIHIGWAVVWQSNQERKGVKRYLKAIGFRYDYQADGDTVYRLPPPSSG
jgi:hypothetical protein